jgi:hypothetical protein
LCALALAVVCLAFWFFGGANLGWTKTTAPVFKSDPVTEITSTVWEKRFVPGIDFLAEGLAVAAALAGVSILIRKK